MHESTSPSSNQESDEITLKDIILKIQQWWTILWPQRTKIILTALAIGLMAAMYTKFISKPTYTASYQLFFEEDGGSMSSAMRLASSFGLSMGGSGATSSITVQEYLTSRDNISKAMTMVSGQGVMAERYYEYALYEDQEFNEMFYANFGKNQRYTDSILSEITLELNEGFIAASLDEESGTVNFAINGYDEAFVYDLSKALIANTEDAFLDWKKKKGQSAVEAFQGKVDSLEIALDATLRRLGEYQDQNNSLISAVDKMEQMRLSIDMEALKVAYGEYIKGLEMSKADLMNLEPPFKYFDEPTYPLYKEEGSAAKAGVFGSIITSFLLVLFFIGRVEAKNIMAD
jgi:capsule polysaccharide export protein KpsE/RkpR